MSSNSADTRLETLCTNATIAADGTSSQNGDDGVFETLEASTSSSSGLGSSHEGTSGTRFSPRSEDDVSTLLDDGVDTQESEEVLDWNDDGDIEKDLSAYLNADRVKDFASDIKTMAVAPHELPSSSASQRCSNKRKYGWSPTGESQEREATGPSKALRKELIPAVYELDSDSDSPVESVDEFRGFGRTKACSPKRYLPEIDLSVLMTTHSVPSSSYDPISNGEDGNAPLLEAVDKCIQKLTLELKKAPNETDARGPVPVRLNVELHPHQSYALEWLSWRENESPFGGILADEMGLGKTVMMLALICRGKESASRSEDSGWRSSTEKYLVKSETTLVVCPASVMGQWEAEIKSKAPSLKVMLWHGANRESSARVLARYDIVVTSYNTLACEIPKESERFICHSPLLKIKFERIVLDEGHIIRNPGTGMSQAACRLTARHRWLVTGTPVHNKSLDFFSIVKFLHFEPFNDLKVWKQWIGEKFPSAKQSQRLQAIGKALLLRRTKVEVSAGLRSHQKIPDKTVIDVTVAMKKDEREVYDHIESFLRSQFEEILENMEARRKELQNQADLFVGGRSWKPRGTKTSSANMATLFTIILRCRQAAVLPRLVITMLDDDEDGVEDFDPDLHLCTLKNPVFNVSFVSAKLERLIEDLLKLRKEARSRGLPMEKAIVVSQWTSLLDVINLHLSQKGFETVSLTGKTPIADRMDLMRKFNSNKKKPEIMLLSLTAGGCGLNLTGANHLFFMDIHWNPQLELQAQDRIHRFGQTLPVKITRYISEETLESRVLELQSRKLELANGLLTGASVTNRTGAGLSIAEMRKLFNLK